MSFFSRLLPSLLAATLLTSCQQPTAQAPGAPAIERGATLLVQPTFARRIAEIGLYSRASIHHVVIDVLRVDGTDTVLAAQADLAADELGHQLRFEELRYNTTYKLRARAYRAAGTAGADLISDDAESVATVTIGASAPAAATVPIQLVDRPYPTVSTLAEVAELQKLAIDAQGTVYVAQPSQNSILKLTANGPETIADAGDGLNYPHAVAVDGEGTLYIADTYNHRIVTLDANGVVTHLAGSEIGLSGSSDGEGASASFFRPYDLAVDAAGTVYVADTENNRICTITPEGVVTTIAGSSDFYGPTGIAVDDAGTVYVADTKNHRIRTIRDGVIATLAGTTSSGTADGQGADARFWEPSDVALDAAGNVFVADKLNHRIRKITPEGDVTTIAGAENGYVDDNGYRARFNAPQGLVAGPDGRLYVSDFGNNRIRVIE